jgi:prepilin-type N-terminal cleavage/methylation domain-containing protein
MIHPHPLQQSRKPSGRSDGRARGAFTLIELIVVVAIIAALVALALPMLAAANRKAKATRAAADMQSISTGLEAYKLDFGDYPRPDNFIGFATLTKALIAPGPAGGPLPNLGAAPHAAGTIASVGTPGNVGYAEYVAFGRPQGTEFSTAVAPPDNTQWAVFSASDGNNGPGFKARSGGKSYGPYLPADKFKLRGLAILDLWDHPILYFPARPAKPAQVATGWPLLTGGAGLYNAADNVTFFLRPSEDIPANANKAMARMDAVAITGSSGSATTDFDGIVNSGEQAATTGPFLLWSAGPDGNFGVTYAGTDPTPDEIRKVDDITNFTTGQ